MIESITEYLQNWNSSKNERQKLQGVYLVLGSVIVIVAGLVTFLNARAGYVLVSGGFIMLGAFLINTISWHLLSSIFLSQLKTKKISKTTAKK